MDIEVSRAGHPAAWVRLVGVRPSDRYVEVCWMPFLDPLTVAVLRRCDGLAAPAGGMPRSLSYKTLSELLGLPQARREATLRVLGFGPTKRPTIANRHRIDQALRRAHRAGLVRWQPAARRLEVYERLPIIESREAVAALPPLARAYHDAYLEDVRERLVHRVAKDLGVPTTAKGAAVGESSMDYLLRRLKAAAAHGATPRSPGVSR